MGYSDPTYKVSDIVTDIKRTFGDEAGVQITDADILRWINSGQLEIINLSGPNRSVSTADVINGQAEYSISSLSILKIQSIRYKGLPLEFMSFQDYENYIASNDPSQSNTGTPVLWTEWGGRILLYPTPNANANASLSIYYISEPVKVVALTDFLTVPDMYYNRLLDYVLARAYELDEDPQNSQFKLNQFNKGVNELASDETSQETSYPMVTILPEDE